MRTIDQTSNEGDTIGFDVDHSLETRGTRHVQLEQRVFPPFSILILSFEIVTLNLLSGSRWRRRRVTLLPELYLHGVVGHQYYSFTFHSPVIIT